MKTCECGTPLPDKLSKRCDACWFRRKPSLMTKAVRKTPVITIIICPHCKFTFKRTIGWQRNCKACGKQI